MVIPPLSLIHFRVFPPKTGGYKDNTPNRRIMKFSDYSYPNIYCDLAIAGWHGRQPIFWVVEPLSAGRKAELHPRQQKEPWKGYSVSQVFKQNGDRLLLFRYKMTRSQSMQKNSMHSGNSLSAGGFCAWALFLTGWLHRVGASQPWMKPSSRRRRSLLPCAEQVLGRFSTFFTGFYRLLFSSP